MNGRAWIVEINYGLGEWLPANGHSHRDAARRKARNMRAEGWRVRVRQYIRQQETRP